jgi:hypothetical protein
MTAAVSPARQVEVLNAGALEASALRDAAPEPVTSGLPPEAHDEVTWPWPWPGPAATLPQGTLGHKSAPQTLAPETYRTLCVRLCDGGFFPISFATTRARFARDDEVCRGGCGVPARLYVYRNPGGRPEYMHDLAGNAYAELATAFLFRAVHDRACTCKQRPLTVAAHERQPSHPDDEWYATPPIRADATQAAAETMAASGTGEGTARAEAEKPPTGVPDAEPRRRARPAPASGLGAAALEGRANFGPRRREAARRRYDGTDWRITPYQPF